MVRVDNHHVGLFVSCGNVRLCTSGREAADFLGKNARICRKRSKMTGLGESGEIGEKMGKSIYCLHFLY